MIGNWDEEDSLKLEGISLYFRENKKFLDISFCYAYIVEDWIAFSLSLISLI